MSPARRDRSSCRLPGARRTAGRVVLLAAVLCAGLGATEQAAAAIVRLHPQARATGPVVRLGDVADVLDPQPETVDRLRRLELAPAPAAGGRLVLDYASIRSRLEVLGIDLSRTEFSGSTRIEVLSGVAQAPVPNDGPARRQQVEQSQKRAERLVAEAIERSVRQRDPSVGRVTAEVRFSAEESERLLAVAGRGFDVRGGRAPWDAPQEFVLQYLDEREQPRFFTVACRLVRVPSVLAARYALPKGYVLREADLVWRDADVPGPVATRLEEVVGRETRKTLREGEPIVLDAVQQVPLIRSGDIVTVSARRPGITVRRQLKSRGDGAVGETVTLVTLDGRQQLLARVTGYHEAEAIGGDGADVGGGLPTDRVRFVRSDEGTTGGVRDARPDLRRPPSN